MEKLFLVLLGVIILCLAIFTVVNVLLDEAFLRPSAGITGPTGTCLVNDDVVAFETVYNVSTYPVSSSLLSFDLTSSQAIGNVLSQDSLRTIFYNRLDQTQSGSRLKFTSGYGNPDPNVTYIFCTLCITGDNCNSTGVCDNNSRPILTNIDGTPFYFVSDIRGGTNYINLLIDSQNNVFVYPEI